MAEASCCKDRFLTAKLCENITMFEQSVPTKEGLLIERARNRALLSIREAAKKAGVSEGRWRQVEKGYQAIGNGLHRASRARTRTLVQMAQVVRVTSDELRAAGRSDAADMLRELTEGEDAAKRLDELDRRINRLKANPKAREQLEKILGVVEDCYSD